MELKDRKRINNGLPGFVDGLDVTLRNSQSPAYQFGDFDDLISRQNNQPIIQMAGPTNKDRLPIIQQKNTTPSSAAGIGPWFALGEWIGSGIGAGINTYQGSNDIITGAGTSTGYVNGMAYQRGNDIDTQQLRRDYNRDTAMSFLTNPFKGITQLLGHGKQMRAIRRAAQEQAARNTAAMAGASTSYLQQEYAKEYGNPQEGILYSKNGKDAVHTAEGEYDINPNSKVEGGEVVYNQEKGTAHVIPGKADGDNNYAAILPSDVILTNKFGIAAKARSAAKALESTNTKRPNRGQLGKKTDEFIKSQAISILDDAANEQKQYRELGMLDQPEMKKYKNGKLSNWWIDGLGALTATGNLIADSLQRIKHSNTYAENPYENNALNELASLRIDPYPINQQLRQQERRNMYAVNRAGGLSGAQKAYANIANGLATLNTIAASNADIQKQNNAYRSAYASAALNAGQADRTARMQANQWDLDYYSKAHASKQQMMQQNIHNMLAALQQGYANSYKRHTFDRLMSHYDNSYA